MAKMIPTNISPEVKSNAERNIFKLFQNSEGTEGWVVFHSLGISNHNRVIFGEMDFLVCAPKLGIFAIEVKGGRVRRQEGMWVYTNKYGNENKKARGPFDQSREAVFSLFGEIKKRVGSNHRLSGLLFSHGVMFPDIVYEVEDFDNDQLQVYDLNSNRNVVAFIGGLANYASAKWKEIYHFVPDDKKPTRKEIKELTNLIRRDFDIPVPLSAKISLAEKELFKFTEEQINGLDQIEDNARIIVEGHAGTGKTLMAIEEVKRSVVEKKRTAFFCFNKNLATWLQNQFSILPEELQPDYVGTFHSYLISIADQNLINQNEMDDNFYQSELPLLALEAIEEQEISFDKIIIDEAQDILTPDNCDVIDGILNKGITRGKWTFYGDYRMQKIFSENRDFDQIEYLEDLTSFVRFRLKKNCRNTKIIGEEVNILVGKCNTEYLDSDTVELPVEYLVYADEEEAVEKLRELLNELSGPRHIEAGQVTILSPRRIDSSIVKEVVHDFHITQCNGIESDQITFSTVHSYKGLENSVIILCDISTLKHKELLYVGLSRARTKLYILDNKSAEKERKLLLRRYYSE